MTDPDAYAALLDARAELSDLDAAAWLAEAHGGRLDAVTAQRRADLAVRWVIVPTLCLLCRPATPGDHLRVVRRADRSRVRRPAPARGMSTVAGEMRSALQGFRSVSRCGTAPRNGPRCVAHNSLTCDVAGKPGGMARKGAVQRASRSAATSGNAPRGGAECSR